MASTRVEGPGAVLDRLCEEQGRRKDWVARELGLSPSALSTRISGRTPFSKLEREKLGELFDVAPETFEEAA